MKKILFTFCALITLHTPVWANNKTSILEIEKYLNSITTLEADFQQYTPGNPTSSGTFYLSQPRKFLWQYKLPHEQKLVSTGSRLFFHDPETEQTTQLPFNYGFAAILTKKPLSLTDEDFIIHSVLKEDNMTRIELSLEDAEERVVLKFSENPKQLISMSSKDNFGQGVDIVFSNHKQGHVLKKELFKFVPAVEEF